MAGKSKDQGQEIIELLNELRVALPGVQVLFAFLLIVPFSQGWAKVTDGQKASYFIAFLATTMASAFLIAPTAHHRLQWRDGEEEWRLRTANSMTVAGTALLALAITAVVYFVTDSLFGAVPAWILTVSTAVLFTGLWYVLPLRRRSS